jgi:hypothetical protein
LKLFMEVCEIGISEFETSDLEFIRDFCLGVNKQLINESYAKLPMPSMRKQNVIADGRRAWA